MITDKYSLKHLPAQMLCICTFYIAAKLFIYLTPTCVDRLCSCAIQKPITSPEKKLMHLKQTYTHTCSFSLPLCVYLCKKKKLIFR